MSFDANDPEAKAAIKEAVEAAVEAAKGPLDAKNKDLLNELKEARKGKTIDPAEIDRLEGKISDLETKLTTAEKAVKDAQKLADKAAKDLEAESGFTHKLLAENGVVTALSAAGVTDPAYLDAAKALHLSQVKVVAEGGERKAMYGDKPLDEAIKEWAAGDVGKKFVAAPVNGGGGSPGSKLKADAKTMTRTAFNALDQNQKAEAGMQSAKGDLQIVEG